MKKYAPWLILGAVIGGYMLVRRYMPKLLALPGQAGEAVSKQLIETFKPTGVYNTAGEAAAAYTMAVNKIIAANSQFTPALVKRTLIRAQWKLNDPIPNGLNRPSNL